MQNKMQIRKIISTTLVIMLLLSMIPFNVLAAKIDPLVPSPDLVSYIPLENFAQISAASSENDSTILRSGTTSTSAAFTANTSAYWSGVASSGISNVGSNRAFFMRVPVPTVTADYLEDPGFKVSLEFTVQNAHNQNASGHYIMTIFEVTQNFPSDMSTMIAIGSSAASTIKTAYPYKATVANSNRIPGSGAIGMTLSFDLTEYYLANSEAENWEFLMLPNNSMLDFYSASATNQQELRPRLVVTKTDSRTALQALTIEDTFSHGDVLPDESKGEAVSWSCVTQGQAARVVNNTIVADLTETHVVTLRGTIGEAFRDFENVTILDRRASVNASIMIKGEDVDKAAESIGALTFKGFGVLNANSTSELFMDYKAQNPEKYWEMMEILFGGTNPLFSHIKMEMGNDNDNSTGAEPATKRFEDEDANAARSKGFQMVSDAKKVNPDVKVSILRWGMPRWITGGTGNLSTTAHRNNFYIWYRDTMFDIYERYGYVLDFINPDQNEAAIVPAQMKYFNNRLRNENDFPEGWTEEDKEKYRSIRLVGGDQNNNGNSTAGTILNDAELMEILDITGFHYFNDGGANVRRLWEEFDFEVWYNEGCAIFGTMEASANAAGGDAIANAPGSIGGYQSPLAMIDGFMTGFIEDNARKSHYIFQPAIGSFYEGSQYSHKNLMLAADPWSGYVHYDEALYLLSHYTTFSKAGWENEDNTNGIWRMIDQASACWPGSSNEHAYNQNGVPSYLTLADPDKTAFSTIFVNNSNKTMFYKLELDADMKIAADAKLAVWETKANSYMKNRETLTKIDGAYWLEIVPYSIVTVTSDTEVNPVILPSDNERTPLDSTITGKGHDTTDNILYADNFSYEEEPDLDIWNSKTKSSYKESYIESRGGGMRYAVVKNGAFEAIDGKLKQLLTAAPSAWNSSQPNLIVGDFRWMNYKASIDVDLSKNTASASAAYGRLTIRQQIGPNSDDSNVNGYSLRVYKNGTWALLRNGSAVVSGTVTARDTFKLSLEGADNVIKGWIDDELVVTYTDQTPLYAGRVKLGTNWGLTEFDNLLVETVPGYVPYAVEFIDDGMSKLTYSDTGWYRTSGNGGAAENFGRSLSTKQADGATLEFDINGTGFSLLGSNGNYSSARMDIYIDDMETPFVTGASGRNLSASERRREIYLLDGLENKEHKVKIVFTAGTFVMDGVMILGPAAAGERNSATVTDDLSIAAIQIGAKAADFLPATVKVSGYDKGVPFTDREVAATWEEVNLTIPWSAASIKGTAMMGEVEIPLTFAVNLLVPDRMVYFIDAGTRTTASYTGGSDTYNTIKALFPELLNEVSDRSGNGTSSAIGTQWGSAPGPRGDVTATGAQASNMYTSLLYAAQNTSGSDLNYDLYFDKPGTYALAMGFYMPSGWGSRSLNVIASGTPLAAQKTLLSAASVTTTPQLRTGMTIDVLEPGMVRLTFQRNSGDAATISWIGVNEVYHEVKASVIGDGGTVTPSYTSLAGGARAEVTVTANEGYYIAGIYVDSQSINVARVNSYVYTIDDVRKSYDIQVKFIKEGQIVEAGITEDGKLSFSFAGDVDPEAEITLIVGGAEITLVGGEETLGEYLQDVDVESGEIINLYGVKYTDELFKDYVFNFAIRLN